MKLDPIKAYKTMTIILFPFLLSVIFVVVAIMSFCKSDPLTAEVDNFLASIYMLKRSEIRTLWLSARV